MFYLPEDYNRYCLQPGDVVIEDGAISATYIIESTTNSYTKMDQGLITRGSTAFTIDQTQHIKCFKRWLESYNVKIGTEVEIIHEPKAWSDGWPHAWTKDMHKIVNKKSKAVVSYDTSHAWVKLDDCVYYPYFCLKVIDQPALNLKINIEKEKEVEINLLTIRSVL